MGQSTAWRPMCLRIARFKELGSQPKVCKSLDCAAQIDYLRLWIHTVGRDPSTEVGVTSTGARPAGGVVTEWERSLSLRAFRVCACPVVALGAGLCGGLARAQAYSDLFNMDQLLDFCITMDPTDRDALRNCCTTGWCGNTTTPSQRPAEQPCGGR